jgi:serine/threonine protein kinase
MTLSSNGHKRIKAFDLPPGRTLAGKYRVLSQLGGGWEGEVYKITEIRTGIERTAKLFYPHRNLGNKTLKRYAKRLHKLRQCPIVIQYHTEEIFRYKRTAISFLVSEFVGGEILPEFLAMRPGKRLSSYEALHLLYVLVKGVECIHRMNEYHGDLHAGNIIINRFGLEFDLKLLDLFHWDSPKRENRQDDICDLVRILYDAIGGAKHYSKQPKAIKYICCGLKRSLILDKFRTVGQLRTYLETMEW